MLECHKDTYNIQTNLLGIIRRTYIKDYYLKLSIPLKFIKHFLTGSNYL